MFIKKPAPSTFKQMRVFKIWKPEQIRVKVRPYTSCFANGRETVIIILEEIQSNIRGEERGEKLHTLQTKTSIKWTKKEDVCA
jgi:hypothetical protein